MKTSVLKYTSLSLVLLGLGTASTPAQVVAIPDPSLQQSIRTALSKPTGDITVAEMESLTTLDASMPSWDAPKIGSLQGLEAARNLTELNLSGDWFDGWLGFYLKPNLSTGDLSPLAGLNKLTTLNLYGNLLTNLTLPDGLSSLTTLDLGDNFLTDFPIRSGLPSLTTLDLSWNELTNLTLPAGLSGLTNLILTFNPLQTLVLPQPVAANSLVVPPIAVLRTNGVAVYTYPLATRLAARSATAETFSFTLAGPPAVYRVQVTSDFLTWSDLNSLTNTLGSAQFNDPTAGQRPHTFYRVRQEQ